MKHQRGVTLASLLVLLLILGFILYGAARVAPAYTDYWLVQRVLQQIAAQPDINDIKDSEIRMRLAKDLRMNNVAVVGHEDIEIERVPNGVHLSTEFSVKTPFIGAVHLLMEFQPEATTK